MVQKGNPFVVAVTPPHPCVSREFKRWPPDASFRSNLIHHHPPFVWAEKTSALGKKMGRTGASLWNAAKTKYKDAKERSARRDDDSDRSVGSCLVCLGALVVLVTPVCLD